MKQIFALIIKMTLGFFLCALGTVLALNSHLGLSPWDVFHQGLTHITNLTIGQASIAVGLIVVLISRVLGLQVGIGTILNMIVIGCFVDFIIYTNIIPVCDNIFTGTLMLIGSLFATAMGGYLYISCEMGCGPRDGLMIVLVKLTGKSISIMRFFIEAGALAIGWMLGGTVGIGTLVTVLGVGYCVQVIFKLFDFDVKALNHKNIKEGLKFMNQCITN